MYRGGGGVPSPSSLNTPLITNRSYSYAAASLKYHDSNHCYIVIRSDDKGDNDQRIENITIVQKTWPGIMKDAENNGLEIFKL